MKTRLKTIGVGLLLMLTTGCGTLQETGVSFTVSIPPKVSGKSFK